MPYQPMIAGTRYMISAGHYLATQAGFDILEAGGNAIDAGVAAGIALGVVQSDIVQVPGVAPIMIRLAETGEVLTISGLGWWPKAASLELFVEQHGGTIPTGLIRTVVPAAPDAWITALQRYGTMSFGEVSAAAIRFAREGFAMHPWMTQYIESCVDAYREWPTNAAIYLPDGKPPQPGELFVQTDLARSLQFMADQEAAASSDGRDAGLNAARDAFYRGDLASEIVRFHAENGGLLTAEDMAEFRVGVEPPVKVAFQGTDVYTCGPWCQGPVLAQMLSLLDGYDLNELGHNSPQYIHLLTEAMKLSFADRERYYGDPRFVDVPMETLLSADYAAKRREMIDWERAYPEMPPAGEAGEGGTGASYPPSDGGPGLAADTSYVCVVDGQGNAFSATPSDVSFEGPVIPGTGFCPSSRGSQSFAIPGHASSVVPGKRPRLTPNPALAVREGEFVMPFGTPGGDAQTQGMLQVFLNRQVFGMNVQEAVEAPRFVTHSFPNSFEPHKYFPGRLEVEGRVAAGDTDRLADLGHQVTRLDDLAQGVAGICIIEADRKTGQLSGGADPRRPSRAMGW
ncbi:MAG: gamma-glutamyltransferase family protein [Minwuiales bacterium]|nr:gamma-glutamyltransferase family protein [Minwuiales bacterium]